MKLSDLVEKLKNGFCFDTETAGKQPQDALTIHSLELVGIAVSVAPGEAFYLPVPAEYDKAFALISRLKGVFEDPFIAKTGHNLKFDMNVLRRYGVRVQGPLFDTMIAHYLCNPQLKHGLKAISMSLLGYKQIEISELLGRGKYQLSMRNIPVIEVSDYACEDADQTLQLRHVLEPMLKKKKLDTLFHTIECPLIYVLADMEYEGIRVNPVVLNKISEEAYRELAFEKERLDTLSGIKNFNPNSTAQLRELLFEKLALDSGIKTPSGNLSTGKKILYKLRNEHPVIPCILKYKELQTLTSHFMSSLLKKIHPKTKRVHTSFQQAVVATGRLSASNPNLQNIPKTQGLGRQIRSAFVPRDEHHVLIAADYSQIELRVMAHFSKDKKMIAAFKRGLDIHLATASKIFNLPLDKVTSAERKIAKTINFGLNYMMGHNALAERIAEATNEPVDVEQAKEYMQKYFTEFKGVEQYQEDAYFFAIEHGYSQTLFGRRRYIKDINSGFAGKRNAAKRMAVNTPIQGSAADIIKKAMVDLYRELPARGFATKMVLQIHDELVFDVPRSELDAVIPVIRELMESAVQLVVPIVVDINSAENWLAAH